MYSPRLVNVGDTQEAAGRRRTVWTASVCTRLDRQQTFLSWTREWQEDDYDQLGNLLDPKLRKEKERRIRVGVEAETLRLRSPE